MVDMAEAFGSRMFGDMISGESQSHQQLLRHVCKDAKRLAARLWRTCGCRRAYRDLRHSRLSFDDVNGQLKQLKAKPKDGEKGIQKGCLKENTL